MIIAQEILMLIGQHLVVSYSGERIVQMVFIRFQYHLQRHFVVLVVARLVVDITIMQVPIATRRFVFIPMDLQDLSVGLLQVPNKQWGMTVNQATTFTYPIAFSSNNVLAFKQAKSNSNGNNYLMREAGIGIPNNISVSLPGTSPALSFYVFVIGW